MGTPTVPTVNGWRLYAHPCFTNQLESLVETTAVLRNRDPNNYRNKKPVKILAAVRRLVLEDVPANPEYPRFRQGATLGAKRKYWFRAKFFQQYRLSFQFRKEEKVIIYAWINDGGTLRAYGSKTDAYKIFGRMLDGGSPPDGWVALLKASEGIEKIEPENE